MAGEKEENIFTKILDKKLPCFKVYESHASLAFLDAYPMVEGHTVVITKQRGHTDWLSMPPARAVELLADVQKVAEAVQKATGATGINIWQNNGEDAGQTIPHPHFHVVPRTANDGLYKNPEQPKEMISEEAASPLQTKIEAALNPPKPLRKAKFGNIGDLRPTSTGMNLKVKVVGTLEVVESKAGKFWEVLCGDASGTVVVSLREQQKDAAAKDAVLEIRNGATKMVGGYIRVAVDKWGKIAASEEGLEGEVEMDTKKNLSSTQYEKV